MTASAAGSTTGRPHAPDDHGDLGAVMGRMARTLQHEHGDVPATLASITAAAVRSVPGVDWASVSLVSGRRVSSQAATDARASALDALQTETGEGPCLDSLREQTTVLVPDFGTETRWPRFAARAAQVGVGSLLAFQLFTDGNTLGALNLFAESPHAFHDESEAVGDVFAAHAAVALSAARQETNLRAAIDRRDLIGQAKGILMERHRLTASQAFAVLVETSSHVNRKLFEVAEELASTGSMPTR
ncbi:GAF and ANTAR domain-containing protein [Modestobacter versicolor]|uniref:GAF and ANTAR domain-containing protein n=1 Tax=Modestobacter versicolor TaxID=429133 RepID=UPI0034DEFF9F